MESNTCPRCKGENTKIIDYKCGEIVCCQCGFVFEKEFIDDHNEQRFFSKNCSANGFSNKDLSRTSGPISTYKFGEDNEVKLIGKKIKNNKENNFYKNKYNHKNKDLTEKEKKILKKESDLTKVDSELKKLCNFFDIKKAIYEMTKSEIIKLYDYGKINIRSPSWRIILGLILNYTLKTETEYCFSKEDIINYFKCDFETLKKESAKIFPFVTKNSKILQNGGTKDNIKLNSENNLFKYFTNLQEDILLLIKKIKIDTFTGITDSYDIISFYIKKNIFNIDVIPTICLAGGSLIFCIKLYNIQFTVTYKRKDVLDESYNMNTPEEEEKLINYIAKKCGTGINADKLRAVYLKMIKYKNILCDHEKFKNYLDIVINEKKK